jgi:hypothetical protein
LHEKARVFLKNKIESKNSFDLIWLFGMLES